VYELYWRQASVTKASPDLRPENIDATELVLEQYVGSRWRVSMNGFTYHLRGLVGQTEDPADGLLVYRNLNAVDSQGFEVEAEGRWARDLRVRISQTVQRSLDPDIQERLTNSPTSVFQATVESPLGRTGLRASMDMQSLSGRRTLVGTWTSGHTVTNLTISTPRLGRRLEVNASIWNLFGSTYGDPGSEEHRQTLIPQDGRTVGVKARMQF
jgi:iron complex outermembrane receptor protein